MSVVITEAERRVFARVGAVGGASVTGKKKRRSMAHYQRIAKLSAKVRRENADKRKAASGK